MMNTKKVTKKDTQVGFQHADLHSRSNYQVSMSFSKRVRTEIGTVICINCGKRLQHACLAAFLWVL